MQRCTYIVYVLCLYDISVLFLWSQAVRHSSSWHNLRGNTCAAVWVVFQPETHCQISAWGVEQKLSLNKNASGIEQTSSTVRQKTRRPYRTLRASLPPKQRQKLSGARSDTALTHKLKCFFYSSSGFQHGVSPKGEKRALPLAFCQGYREGSWVSSTLFFFRLFSLSSLPGILTPHITLSVLALLRTLKVWVCFPLKV